jgi:hypothetical protein
MYFFSINIIKNYIDSKDNYHFKDKDSFLLQSHTDSKFFWLYFTNMNIKPNKI